MKNICSDMIVSLYALILAEILETGQNNALETKCGEMLLIVYQFVMAGLKSTLFQTNSFKNTLSGSLGLEYDFRR